MTTGGVVNVRGGQRYDVYVGRGRDPRALGGPLSPWGNPFAIGRDGTREEVIALFERWVRTSNDAGAVWIRRNVRSLRGKVLGCWCSPASCHGEVLARIAEE